MNPSETYLREVLDDLSSRFILNLPAEELGSSERVCFQAELAFWFYEDFYRDPSSAVGASRPLLPPFNLKSFIKRLFAHVPILAHYVPMADQILNDFIRYKIQVPVCGAILINPTYEKCLMVKGWNAKSCWSFPKGKINEDESEASCAVREAEEEIGFDITPHLDASEYIDYEFNGQPTKLYLIRNVPESTPFAPQTRKEISDIAWHSIEEAVKNSAVLHKRYFPAMTALYKLREWIRSHHLAPRASRGPKKKKALLNSLHGAPGPQASPQAVSSEEAMTDEAETQAEIEDFLFSFLQRPSQAETSVDVKPKGESRALSLLSLLKTPLSRPPLSQNEAAVPMPTFPRTLTQTSAPLIDTFIRSAKPTPTQCGKPHDPSSFLASLRQPQHERVAQASLLPAAAAYQMQHLAKLADAPQLSLPPPSLCASLTRLPQLDLLADAISHYRRHDPRRGKQ